MHTLRNLLILTVVCLYSLQACTPRECPLALPATPVTINGKILTVEIAATAEARHCGLSNRNHLNVNRGMLFVYEYDQKPYFWMKDTAIPLSIIFIDANHIALEHHDLSPHSTMTVSSDKLVRYALEVNRSWFDNNAIKPGDKVMFTLPANIEIR